MSDFVSGAVSGLIGAIVGGTFPALGARAQVKGMIAVARLQISADRDQQARNVLDAQRNTDLTGIVKALVNTIDEIHVVSEEHYLEYHDDGRTCSEAA